jgi:hypothetical protein
MEFGTPFGIFLGTVGTTMCHSNETQPNQPTKRLGVHESNFDGNESTIQFGVPMILMPEMHLAIFECTTGFQKCTSKKNALWIFKSLGNLVQLFPSDIADLNLLRFRQHSQTFGGAHCITCQGEPTKQMS